MNIRCYDSIIKKYTEIFVSVEEDETYYKVSRSFIPKKYIRRTPELMYILEYLKCDGTASLIKNKNSIKGELLFITTNKKFEEKLKQIVKKQFSNIHLFQRKDGFGISSLVLTVILANKYNIPVGKKQMFKISEPKNIKEAKMIIRAIIDSEGNIDDYSGNIVVGNKYKEYLESIKNVLSKYFRISATTNLSIIKTGYSPVYRLGIFKDSDIIKLHQLKLFEPNKQNKLDLIKESLDFYYNNKEKLKQIIINKCIKPMTIRQISNKIGIAPFVVKEEF